MSVNIVEDPDYFKFDSDAALSADKIPQSSSPNLFSQCVNFIRDNYPNACWAAKIFTYFALCIRVTPILVHFAAPAWRRMLGN